MQYLLQANARQLCAQANPDDLTRRDATPPPWSHFWRPRQQVFFAPPFRLFCFVAAPLHLTHQQMQETNEATEWRLLSISPQNLIEPYASRYPPMVYYGA